MPSDGAGLSRVLGVVVVGAVIIGAMTLWRGKRDSDSTKASTWESTFPSARHFSTAAKNGVSQGCVALVKAQDTPVETASDGESALALLETVRPPALILLDMRMPRMNGAELARELRKRGPAPPIVVMTAAENARTRASDIDAAGFLAKPFSIEDLLATVRRFAPR